MKKWIVLMACVSLVAAGCGDDDDDEGGGGGAAEETVPTPTAEETETATTAAPAEKPKKKPKTVKISLKNIKFAPASVTVKVGTPIKWTNDESVNHDVTKTGGPGPDFKSGAPGSLAQGATFTHTVKTPGTIEYVCKIHAPGMAGTITVE
jgi:plastocyanin